MTTEEVAASSEALLPLEVSPATMGELDLGEFAVPYIDLEEAPYIHTHISVGSTQYAYERSFPIKGHSAVMPAAVSELLAAGKRILVAERSDRYVMYVA